MREIKFRAWNKVDRNGMIDLKKITPLALDSSLSINGLFLPFDDNIILMQFTGLLDKNEDNIFIYDGDIVDSHGKLVGNKHENKELLENESNLLIDGFGTKTWSETEKKGLARGLRYAE